MSKEVVPTIQYSCHSSINRDGELFVAAHTLLLIISGSLHASDLKKSITLQTGDLGFFRKNTFLKFIRRPATDADFRAISITLNQKVLESFAKEYEYQKVKPAETLPFKFLPGNSLLGSFLNSLQSFEQIFRQESAAELLNIKVKEAILTLLMEQPELKSTLFDFSVPEKQDLQDFMNRHYQFNVTISRYALMSGRSLSTFKREFATTFHTSPSKWLLNKRLEEAHYLIKNKRKKATNVYLELGFADLSHFSFAFKKRYGIAPSML